MFHGRYQYLINRFSAHLRHMLKRTHTHRLLLRRPERLSLLACLIAHNLNRVFRAYLVKNSIATNEDEVQLVVDRHRENVRICDDTLGIAAILLHLGHAVAECA